MDNREIRTYQKIQEYLSLALFSLLCMFVVNYNYLKFYFQAGWPAGWDASAHFTISQLYYESHWPKLDGRLESFYQGFNFPRFYPPLFYLICGFFYWAFPSIDRDIVFKLLSVNCIAILPALLTFLAKLWGLPQKTCYIVSFFSILLLSTGDKIAYVMPGFDSGIETGLVTQGLGACLLLILLILEHLHLPKAPRFLAITITSWWLFLSNFHVIQASCIILFLYVLISAIFFKKIDYLLIISLISGFLLASPWYLNVLYHADSTPSIPVGSFEFNSSVYGCLVIGVLSLIVVVLAQTKVISKIDIYSIVFLIAIPIFNFNIIPFGFKLAWQSHRLFSIANLFLPIFIANGILSFVKLVKSYQIPVARLKICTYIVLLTFCFSYIPIRDIKNSLSKDQTSQLKFTLSWLRQNPSEGYFIVPFTKTLNAAPSIIDIALSHYLTLSGAQGIWGVFRESSFNSIFTAALRNSISFNYESFGIPSKSTFEPVDETNIRSRVLSLSKWGISRIILDTTKLSDYKSIIDLVEIEFSNNLVTILKLKSVFRLSYETEFAQIFLGNAINLGTKNKSLDFARIALDLCNPELNDTPILIFKSCEQIYEKLGNANWNITCSDFHPCCDFYVRSTSEILTAPTNQLKLSIENKTPLQSEDLIAAPWRKATKRS